MFKKLVCGCGSWENGVNCFVTAVVAAAQGMWEV